MSGWARIKTAVSHDTRHHFFMRANTTGCGMRAVSPEGELRDAPGGLACVPCARAWRNVWPTPKAVVA